MVASLSAQIPVCRTGCETLQTIAILVNLGSTDRKRGCPYPACVAEIPILADLESRVTPEELLEDISVPENNGTMREDGASIGARKVSRQAGQLVLKILSLLNICALRLIWSRALDGVSNADSRSVFAFATDPIRHNRQICRQKDIVVNEHAILKFLRKHYPDELCSDLATNRDPSMIDTIRLANILCIIQRCGRVSVGQDKNLVRFEDLERMFDRRW